MTTDRAFRVGVDVGGTFTDIAIVSDGGDPTTFWKVPSTPVDPSEGMLAAISDALVGIGAQNDEVRYLAHGTTVATNMLLERSGSDTALVTTEGFRDLLEIGRGQWPVMYDLDAEKPKLLVDRWRRFEVRERTLFDGSTYVALDEERVAQIARAIADAGIRAVAVCYINSYANPAHERRTREIISKFAPDVTISISSDVLPEYREYERLVTTVANAYLSPRMSDYLLSLTARVRDAGIKVEPLINSSSGGLLPVRTAAAKPVLTVMSGPSAGLIGAVDAARRAGFQDVITFDMGGTSTDVALIEDLEPSVVTAKEFEGLTLAVPTADVVSIGAGGGSIAYVDTGGLLKVGPASAGAVPGPACYARGGTLATVTDAMVTLGYLNRGSLLGGRMRLDAEAGEQAIARHVAAPLGLPLEQAALGVLEVARANIEQAISVVSVQRGYDPRDFSLLAYGGAGPQHATAIARNLMIGTVIVPHSPGTLCALGLLTSDMRTDYSHSLSLRAQASEEAMLFAAFEGLSSQAREWFAASGVASGEQVIRRAVDMRYVGQHHQIRIPVPDDFGGEEAWRALGLAFTERHQRLYGHSDGGETEIVAARVTAVGLIRRQEPIPPQSRREAELRRSDSRDVYFTEEAIRTPVFDRSDLLPGDVVDGPAIVDQMDTTTIVLPDQTVNVDGQLNLIIAASRIA